MPEFGRRQLLSLSTAMAVTASMLPGRVHGRAFLLTAEEAARWRGEEPASQPMMSPDGSLPKIDILQPDILAEIKAPFPIEVGFRGQPGVGFDLKSLRIAYGFFGVDITDRVLREAVIGDNGFHIEEADIPSGRHRIAITINDHRGARASLDFRFVVA
jgi:hypothetical protein